ncbi:SH3 domain-containing protein [Neolewinella persica]|uniref:hypothetical protein n=1 Tax=Neolewinella persica TaxID=70998 RepID=UPI0003644BA9|nr:hypothetical protein [Neolewinella persica]
MRFLLICFLFSLALSGQAEQKLPSKYVWAESGLTLRAEGNKNGTKLLVIPFGAEVTLTGVIGEQAKILALTSVSYEWDKKETSDPYIMKDYFVEVQYSNKVGYVYSGYLSSYSPESDGLPHEGIYGWLNTIGRDLDTIKHKRLPNEYGQGKRIYQYANGIKVIEEEFEGGGSLTLKIPAASISEGFLIANRFFGVSAGVKNKEEILEIGDFLPELLSVLPDGNLHFRGSMGETKIQVINGLLVIYSAGWC